MLPFVSFGARTRPPVGVRALGAGLVQHPAYLGIEGCRATRAGPNETKRSARKPACAAPPSRWDKVLSEGRAVSYLAIPSRRGDEAELLSDALPDACEPPRVALTTRLALTAVLEQSEALQSREEL